MEAFSQSHSGQSPLAYQRSHIPRAPAPSAEESTSGNFPGRAAHRGPASARRPLAARRDGCSGGVPRRKRNERRAPAQTPSAMRQRTNQAADACIDGAASERAVLPPRSLGTTGRRAGWDSCFTAKELSWRPVRGVRSLLRWTRSRSDPVTIRCEQDGVCRNDCCVPTVPDRIRASRRWSARFAEGNAWPGDKPDRDHSTLVAWRLGSLLLEVHGRLL
jgi:hypothetical protein